jgi:hypothetical protein
MPVPDIENAEAPKAIDILVTLNVTVAVWPRVAPFNNGAGAVYLCGFPVFEESRIHVIAKVFNRFARDPRRLFGRDRGRFD